MTVKMQSGRAASEVYGALWHYSGDVCQAREEKANQGTLKRCPWAFPQDVGRDEAIHPGFLSKRA